MKNLTRNRIAGLTLAGLTVFAGLLIPSEARAGRWSFSINVPVARYFEPHCNHYRAPVHYRYGRGYRGDYYPVYNPVMNRDVYDEGFVDRRGNGHSQRTVEDRHASFYSEGRNEAITRPETTVDRRYGPGFNQERERTTWIGADERPHSTTTTRTTTQDRWGNTHTDTQVSLKNRQAAGSGSTEATEKVPNDKTPRNKTK